MLLRHVIVRLLLAEEYRESVALMPWIAAGYALFVVASTFEVRLYARKQTGRVLAAHVVTAVAAVAVHQSVPGAWYVLAGGIAGTLVGAMLGGDEE